MSNRSWAVVASLTCSVIVLTGALAAALAPPTDDLFGLTKVWQLHLQISAKEWETMQPVGGMRFPGFGAPGGPAKPPAKPAEKPADVHKGGGFGMEFPWALAALTAEGTTYSPVGVRYKGNASYMAAARGLKRNFKIELDHYDPEQRFHGLKTINLNAGALDPTRGREALAYAVFRAAGVPAPRTAFAEVTLTVPGKYDRELLGLYTVVEQVDKTFLQDRFKNNKGLLMKPEGVRGIEYLGDDWERYKSRYHPKHEPSKKEAQRLIDFARLIHRADDAQFKKQIGSFLDIDEFLRFMAANALVVNMDSFFMLGHNYYIYLNPKTHKFVFIPWDLDLSLGGFGMMGSSDQQLDLSLTHPYAGQNRLVDRLLAMPEVSEQYQKLLRELAATAFAKDRLLKDVEAIEKATKEPLAREAKAVAVRKEGPGGFGFGPPSGMGGRSPDLRTFVEKRTASVVAQIEGKSKGYVPAMGFGPGAPGGGRPGGGFGMGNFLARPVLEALDADRDGKVTKEELVAGVKRFFAECDKEKKGTIDEKAIADGLTRLWPRPPGFGAPGGAPGAPPRGPGGFGGPAGGPGALLAPAIARRAGADRGGSVPLDKLVAAAAALFQECDKDKSGSLDEKEIAAGIDLLAPPPPGFGPPPTPPAPGGERAKPEEPKKEEKKP